MARTLRQQKRKPTRKEKRITAKSLKDYLTNARSKNPLPYRKNEGYLGMRTTSNRMSKTEARMIYNTRLNQVMNFYNQRKK